MVSDHNISSLSTKNHSVHRTFFSTAFANIFLANRTSCLPASTLKLCWRRPFLHKCVTGCVRLIPAPHWLVLLMWQQLSLLIGSRGSCVVHAEVRYFRTRHFQKLYSVYVCFRQPSLPIYSKKLLFKVDYGPYAHNILFSKWKCQCESTIRNTELFKHQFKQPLKLCASIRTITRRSDKKQGKLGGIKQRNTSVVWHHERAWGHRQTAKCQTGEHECKIRRRLQRSRWGKGAVEDCARSRKSSRREKFSLWSCPQTAEGMLHCFKFPISFMRLIYGMCSIVAIHALKRQPSWFHMTSAIWGEHRFYNAGAWVEKIQAGIFFMVHTGPSNCYSHFVG